MQLHDETLKLPEFMTRNSVIEICSQFPESTTSGNQHLRFLVRWNPYAYFLDDRPNGGRVSIMCKVARDENVRLVAEDGGRYFLPPYRGQRGWVGLWLDLPDVDWNGVISLVHTSYHLVAPLHLTWHVDRSSLEFAGAQRSCQDVASLQT